MGLQFLDRMLGRLGFILVAARKIRDIGHVHEQAVVPSDDQRYLTDGFKERKAFHIAGRSADLGNDHVGLRVPAGLDDKAADLVGDVRNDLYGFAKVFAVAFFVDDVPVHLARRQIGVGMQVLVNEAFVMSQIEIGFQTVVGHEHFAVLERRHRPRVHIDIRIELLRSDLVSACFQQSS